ANLAEHKSWTWNETLDAPKPAKGTEIEYFDRGDWNTTRKTVRVTFEPTDHERANVRRADNNRLLGWVYPPQDYNGKKWSAHIADAAFQGDSTDDEGYYMDKVPLSLTHRTAAYGRIERKTRKEAVEAMLTDMSSRRPPALGYGRHPDVERYHGDNPAKRAWVLNGHKGVPADY